MFYHHYKEMKDKISQMDKLESIKHEDFTKPQPYMSECNVERARLMFSLRCRMFHCRGNHHGSYKVDDRGCQACVSAGDGEAEEDTQDHIARCPEYEPLRRGLDLTQQSDLITYFTAVMRKREILSRK